MKHYHYTRDINWDEIKKYELESNIRRTVKTECIVSRSMRHIFLKTRQIGVSTLAADPGLWNIKQYEDLYGR